MVAKKEKKLNIDIRSGMQIVLGGISAHKHTRFFIYELNHR